MALISLNIYRNCPVLSYQSVLFYKLSYTFISYFILAQSVEILKKTAQGHQCYSHILCNMVKTRLILIVLSKPINIVTKVILAPAASLARLRLAAFLKLRTLGVSKLHNLKSLTRIWNANTKMTQFSLRQAWHSLPQAIIFIERKVSGYLSESHKKFVNSRILIEWLDDLWYGYIVYREIRWCSMLHKIVKYCPVLSVNNLFHFYMLTRILD